MSLFVPTKFVWRFGGNQVHLCGSFTRWVETVTMSPVENEPSVFQVVVHLPPGYHQYKFIVDGEWRHDEAQPFMPDPLGNVNNWLFVRKPEGSAPAPAGLAQQPSALSAELAASSGAAAAALAQTPSPTSGGDADMETGGDEGSRAAQAPPLAPAPSAGPEAQSWPSSGVSAAPSGARAAPGPSAQPGKAASAPRAPAVPASPLGRASPALRRSGAEASPSSGLAGAGEEPQYTRKAVRDFLHAHTAYELMPESGKVVLLDADLPMRQALHALHEQGVASAPVWDSGEGRVSDVVSASDFIAMLQRLRVAAAEGAALLTEQQMDEHTIRALRVEMAREGRAPKPLVSIGPTDSLASVVHTLYHNRCHMAPILGAPVTGVGGGEREKRGRGRGSGSSSPPSMLSPTVDVLHNATISGVVACLLRHFRASMPSLPLLQQPIKGLALGTWSPLSPHARAEPHRSRRGAEVAGEKQQPGRDVRRVQALAFVQPTTPLAEALGLLLSAGVSCLPVLNDVGVLLDVYARADITMLARGNAYSRLQAEDVTVGQALTLAAPGHAPAPPQALWGGGGGAARSGGGVGAGGGRERALPVGAGKPQRVWLCTPEDTLLAVLERLAVPGVRRVVVVDAHNRQVHAIVSLSDVATYLLL